ncbi:RDD family protein [Streptomyces sp. S1A1-7]|uniref:RDD family protein n=1 Tax=unclassified Streptomyces TaxID=2593676 RepID=UPI0011631510|nr:MULTISPECIES: RDD family protein [unclassified Streptomyces]QDN74689.1 RDD family protein [Streptomyces sp. S1A1-7]QDN93319.1 RDD family protein [Streptomyces sp. RLB3-6]
MSGQGAVSREGVEGIPAMVARAMGREWYKEQLAGMDPLRGQLPAEATVAYVTDAGAAAATGSPVFVLASNGRRAAARFVDTVIASFFALLGFFAVAASAGGAALVVLLPVGFMVGGLLYCVPLVHWWGATVGKRIFGLRVVRLWSNGTLPPSWKDAFIREFDKAAFLSIPVLNLLVGAIFLAQMSKDRASYHQSKFDRVARTVLVRWPAVAGVGN